MMVTIIIPVYNKKRYLSVLLGQIMVQTYTDFECLLIDDGSTDGSGLVCDEFAARDPRFRSFHISNGGVSRARNVGLDAARGAYITFIDSDDGIRPGYLENLVRCMERSGAELVISGLEKVTEDGVSIAAVKPDVTGVFSVSDLLADFARVQRRSGLYGYCAAKLFPRRLSRGIRFGEDLKLAEDFDFYLSIYERIERVCLDDHTDYLYLQHTENSSGSTADEQIDYLAQLRINLHYRSVLQRRGAFTGENRDIVERLLGDYAFFVLFHAPLHGYGARFEALYGLCGLDPALRRRGSMLRAWLLFCLRHHWGHAAKQTMAFYRGARELRRCVQRIARRTGAVKGCVTK